MTSIIKTSSACAATITRAYRTTSSSNALGSDGQMGLVVMRPQLQRSISTKVRGCFGTYFYHVRLYSVIFYDRQNGCFGAPRRSRKYYLAL